MADEENPLCNAPLAALVSPSTTSSDDVTTPKSTCELSGTGGYYKLAEFMGVCPAAAIFRRFSDLHILKLLYLQAELVALETELKYYAEEDEKSSDYHRQKYCRDWQKLKRGRTEEGANKNDRQKRTWIKMSDLLKQYDETIHNTNTLLSVPAAARSDLQLLRNWMPKEGQVWLTGVDYDIWSKTAEEDLMALKGPRHEDFVSRWVDGWAAPWFLEFLFKKVLRDKCHLRKTAIYKTRHVGWVVSIIMAGLASALPVVAVIILSLSRGNGLKLALMAVFTMIFSLFLGFISGAKKTEVFAASAAFAAVQVVFLADDGSCVAVQSKGNM